MNSRKKPLNRWDVLDAVWKGIRVAFCSKEEIREGNYFVAMNFVHEVKRERYSRYVDIEYEITPRGSNVVDKIGEQTIYLFSVSHTKMSGKEKRYIMNNLPKI